MHLLTAQVITAQRDMGMYFLIGLSLKTIEITLKSLFKFLVASLASEMLKDKDMTKRLAVRHLGYSKNP